MHTRSPLIARPATHRHRHRTPERPHRPSPHEDTLLLAASKRTVLKRTVLKRGGSGLFVRLLLRLRPLRRATQARLRRSPTPPPQRTSPVVAQHERTSCASASTRHRPVCKCRILATLRSHPLETRSPSMSPSSPLLTSPPERQIEDGCCLLLLCCDLTVPRPPPSRVSSSRVVSRASVGLLLVLRLVEEA